MANVRRRADWPLGIFKHKYLILPKGGMGLFFEPLLIKMVFGVSHSHHAPLKQRMEANCHAASWPALLPMAKDKTHSPVPSDILLVRLRLSQDSLPKEKLNRSPAFCVSLSGASR